jgi:4-hydroxy-tetrahydrodipicolinate synthase
MPASSTVFKGSFVALVTPMLEDGRVDFAALDLLVDWHISQNSDGIVVMGTTGESALVSETELLTVVEAVSERVVGRIPVIAGCGGISTEKVIRLAKKLERIKLDALLCVTPYYVKPEQSGLIEHYQEVADASNIPVILYNVPGRTACDLSNQSVVKLSQHSNIIGLKDATADLTRIEQLRKQVTNEFGLWSGDDETAFEYVKRGGDGVISVTANIAPKKMHQWYQLLASGEQSRAKQRFEELLPLHQLLFVEANPIPVKWTLHRMGKISAGIRKPLTEPSDLCKNLIEKVLHNNDLL